MRICNNTGSLPWPVYLFVSLAQGRDLQEGPAGGTCEIQLYRTVCPLVVVFRARPAGEGGPCREKQSSRLSE